MGLDNAVGDWVMFIDSDDWIDVNLLGKLLPSSDIDFVLGYYVAEGWNEWVSEPYMDKIYNLQEIKVFLDECLLKSIFVWGKLFKRNIIDQNRLRFDVTISYSEDTIFLYRYIYYVKNVKTCSDAFYHYNCYASTLSNKYESWSVYNSIIKKQFEVINLLEKRFGWNGQVVYNITAYHFFSRYLYYTCCYCSVLSVKKELKMLLSNSIIRKAIKENNRRSWKGKFVDWLMLHDFLWLSVLLLYVKNRRF